MQPEEITRYLDAVERSAGKTFSRRREIAALMEAAAADGVMDEFAELTFLAKFVANASNILQRRELPAEETANLVAQFTETVERIKNLLRLVLRNAGGTTPADFERRFMALEPQSLAELLALAAELAWIKNYELDRAARN